MITCTEDCEIQHVAIIMDGNGRWAQKRSHSRVWGHIRGSKVVSDIVQEAKDRKLKALTLYAFSTENWSRPYLEVKILFALLKKFLLQERKSVIDGNIRFKVMGNIADLPDSTKKIINDLEKDSADATGLKLTFAFSYGSRTEIVSAINKWITTHPGVEITQKDLTDRLLVPDLGDVDLLIRTGGDQRISNFLLWQIAYSELFFTQTKWPDFSSEEFGRIVDYVSKRERRFGSTISGTSLKDTTQIAEKNRKFIQTTLRS
jgi:undecaprenyl diphosphate synthase